MRRYLSWAVIGAVGATALAATIDALVADESPEASRPSAARPESAPKRASIPACTDNQLAFGIEVIDAPVAVLKHVRGESCRRPDRPLEVGVHTASAQAGGIIFGPEGSLGGTFSPGASGELPSGIGGRVASRDPSSRLLGAAASSRVAESRSSRVASR